MERVLGADRAAGLDRGRCPCSRRARRSPPASAIQKAFDATLDRRAGARRRRGRPHRQHRHQARRAGRASRASTPSGRQIYFGVREHGDGLGDGRHGPARRRAPRRRHVLRLPRLHAPAGAPRLARRRPRWCSSSPTTRSASARTARRTSPSSTSPRCGRSRSCRSSARPTPTRPRQAWRVAVEHRRPDRARAEPPGHPGVHRRLGGRHAARPSSSPRPTTRRSILVGTGSEVPVCVDAAEQLADGRRRRHASCRCRRGTASRPRPAEYRDVGLPDRRAGAVGRGGRHVRLGAVRRRLDRHRPLRRQRARRDRARQARHQRRPRRRQGHAPSSTTSSILTKGRPHGPSRQTAPQSSGRARGSTTSSAATSRPASCSSWSTAASAA